MAFIGHAHYTLSWLPESRGRQYTHWRDQHTHSWRFLFRPSPFCSSSLCVMTPHGMGKKISHGPSGAQNDASLAAHGTLPGPSPRPGDLLQPRDDPEHANPTRGGGDHTSMG